MLRYQPIGDRTEESITLPENARRAVVVGVISGVGGGIIRDNIVDRVPEVLSSGHFYASAVVSRSALNIALLETSIRPAFASTIAVVYIFAVRMLSIRHGWGVPKFEVDDGNQQAT